MLEIRTRSNVFSKRFAVISLSAIALLGGGTAFATSSNAATVHHHPAVVHQIPKWVHWKYADKKLAGTCGKGRPVIIYATGKESGAGDTESVLVCSNGTLWLP